MASEAFCMAISMGSALDEKLTSRTSSTLEILGGPRFRPHPTFLSPPNEQDLD